MTDTQPVPGRRFPLPSRFQLTLTAALLAAVCGVGVAVLINRASVNSASTASATLNDFMGLTSAQALSAPDIALADQNGQAVSLSGLERQGKIVVLEFMDSRCVDICPIISQEFAVAHDQLASDSSRVAFVAVNVNPFHLDQSDVAAFTNDQGLNRVPEWHFLTGTLPQLQDAWTKYAVAVQAPNPSVDVIHTDSMFFIDPSGHERWIAQPTEDHTSAGAAYLPVSLVHKWGVDIALVVKQMLR